MTPNQLNNNKPTIAVLTNMIATPFSEGIIFGASDYARVHNYNVLCFAGSEFNKPVEVNMSRDRIFDLVDTGHIRGLIIPMGALSRYITQDEQLAFLKRFDSIPVITVASDIPGYKNVGYSPRQGMFELVEHLHKEHRVERIAYARATGRHRASEIKKQALIEAMSAHGLRYNEQLELACEMRRGTPVQGLERLFTDNRDEWPQAMVASTDSQAQSLVASLQRMGIRVPDDVIVTGSTGNVDSLFAEPPLTSIVEPTYELGWHAAERVIAAIEGRPEAESLIIPTSLAVRRSCGCNRPGERVDKLVARPMQYTYGRPLTRQQLLTNLQQALNNAPPETWAGMSPGTPEKLVQLTFAELAGEQTSALVSYFHHQLETTLKSEEVYLWGQLALCIHWALMQSYSSGQAGQTLAAELFQVVQTSNEKAGRYRRLEAKRYVGILREIGIQLNSEFNLDEIGQLLAYGLNISDCYISLFEGENWQKDPASCVMAMRDGHRLQLSGKPYSAEELMPPEVADYEDTYALVIMPLSFKEDLFGMCVLNLNERKGVVYESLLTLFSSALKNQLHVRDLKAKEARIRTLAYSDLLTNLPNRSMINDRLNSTVAAAQRTKTEFAVLFIDLDGFKLVNDSLGHKAGDILLSHVAKLFSDCMREGDTLGRFGGDEFVVVLPNIECSSDAAKIADRMIKALDGPIRIHKQSVFITASIGIALYPGDGLSADSLLINADKAMYRSKQNGKNRYGFYQAEQELATSRTVTITNHLHNALLEDSFKLLFQPIIHERTRQVIAAEALIRFGDPQAQATGPTEFIPLAEEIGLIDQVGLWVFKNTCLQQRKWADAGLPLRCSVNVSARQLRNPRMADDFINAIERTGVNPAMMAIEITENAVINDEGSARAALQKLSDYGLSIAIDDFGTGYASLSGLHKIPVDTLKIDQSFVHGCDSDNDSSSIIAAIIMMARGLNLKVIAEGVETKGQLAFLSSFGCDEIQGYLIARPLPAEQMADFIAMHSAPRTTETS
ncbi:EAL domain-containing protein [Reinekea marinisedimentorum]|uniref:Diguanylate cyclase (GGDEF)-like protein n=1 Tax=Reinekea marinisedimentorum TaxID=230495 RepID=A0A4R3I5W1_9GAMM|nr:EAL domain-containing protein [Reinekea marinisedimentorum]TCS40379.1 diguanylate cyclase (GGDEF)-like protein [Reinekea marinisedimentorum]